MQLGDRVTWQSQAAGSTTEKTGEIVVVVPAFKLPYEVMSDKLKEENFPRRYDGSARNHESYIVVVKAGKTDKARPVLYWPRASSLRKV